MIVVKDETAGFVVVTIDNNGNMAFGDGTPISALSVAGNGIIDSNGQIIHGVGSCAINAATGTVNCGIDQSVTVTTQAGRIPCVQLDTTYPAASYFIDFRTPGDPTSGGTESTSPLFYTPVHLAQPNSGSFTITNENEGDGFVDNPSTDYYDSSLASAPCTYRWL